MTRALSMDLRERAMARLEKGETCRQVASALQVAVSSVVKWSQRKRATGSCAPGKTVSATSAPPPRRLPPSSAEVRRLRNVGVTCPRNPGPF
jgi:hypothetical protein